MSIQPTAPLGVTPSAGGWHAEIWAPAATKVAIVFVDGATRVALGAGEDGYFRGELGAHEVGARYLVELDGGALPDPASRDQPDGVHGPSALVDPRRHVWHDDGFLAPSLEELVIYEFHVGTFRSRADPDAPGGRAPGTFATAAGALASLAALGVTAVETMPIASFAGARNWGYDGVFLYAPQATYGGPEGFRAFVDEAHRVGLAVVLDVVYNHLGPEGSVLDRFGPYTSDAYMTPWGPAVNVAWSGSDEVRRFFIENASMWLREYHVDALRLDAVHAIIDPTARPFLAELADAVDRLTFELGRRPLLIAESADNDPRVLRPTELGGYGIDAQWSDDFHHALHVAVTGERRGYYGDYRPDDLVRAVEDGWSFAGRYSRVRGRRHGATADRSRPARFVVAAQNHDQVGNRPGGQRLSSLVGPDAARAVAGVLLTGPHAPLVFMGEEYGEKAPFAYFVDHGDPALLEAVREGRRHEFGESDLLDPADPATFTASCLSDEVDYDEQARATRALYASLLALRRGESIITDHDATTRCSLEGARYELVRRGPRGALYVVANLNETPVATRAPDGRWRLALASRAGAPDELSGGDELTLSGAGFACYLEEDLSNS